MSFKYHSPEILGQSVKILFICCQILVILSDCYVLASNNRSEDDYLSKNILNNDVCSNIFEDNPCAKDILKLFVNQINENKKKIKLLEEKLEKIESNNFSDGSSLKGDFKEIDSHEKTKFGLLKKKSEDIEIYKDFDSSHQPVLDNHIQDGEIEVGIQYFLSSIVS